MFALSKAYTIKWTVRISAMQPFHVYAVFRQSGRLQKRRCALPQIRSIGNLPRAKGVVLLRTREQFNVARRRDSSKTDPSTVIRINPKKKKIYIDFIVKHETFITRKNPGSRFKPSSFSRQKKIKRGSASFFAPRLLRRDKLDNAFARGFVALFEFMRVCVRNLEVGAEFR